MLHFDSDLPAVAAIPEPGGPTRRRFLQGAAVAAGATALLPTWLSSMAAGAGSPLGPDEGVLVVVSLQGGNDSLNTVVPRSGAMRSQYQALRGDLAVSTGSVLPIDADWGYHPMLPRLAARHATGRVAVLNGIGLDVSDLSHFTSAAAVGAGTATADRTTGWVGRYLDGASGWDSGLAGMAMTSVLPLSMVGTRSKVAVAPGNGGIWTGDMQWAWDRVAVDTIRAFSAEPTGLGAWGDKIATMHVDAFDAGSTVNALFSPTLPLNPLTRDLTLAARAINADLGARAVAVELGGWDFHALQLASHASHLSQLDEGIDAFFAALKPALASRVTMVVVSEFGRRAGANGSLGTDHGRAGTAFVIGENVKGGFASAAPSLTALDANGNLVPTVDFRSLYATVLAQWLDADDREVLGATYPQLDLFAAAPGASRPAAAAAAA